MLAGVAGVRPLPFVLSIAAARGLRYLTLGTLAIWYGDVALVLMRTRGRDAALREPLALLVELVAEELLEEVREVDVGGRELVLGEELIEVVLHVPGGLVAVLPILVERAHEDLLDAGGGGRPLSSEPALFLRPIQLLLA